MTVIIEKLNNYKIILASASPRRQLLLKQLGLQFDVQVRKTIESYPIELKREQIAIYLAERKSMAFRDTELMDDQLIITADTIVWQDNMILNKPSGIKEAFDILQQLSGKMHEVITAVCLRTLKNLKSFYACTKVYFKELEEDEINYYVNNFKPFDKAGGYGIQEWIGYIGVEKIEGSYFNVMGLPSFMLYKELGEFLRKDSQL